MCWLIMLHSFCKELSKRTRKLIRNFQTESATIINPCQYRPEETYQQFNTNVFGLLNVTRAFLPHMRARKSGVIVNIGSIGGWGGTAGAGLYCATKFALEGITESLRNEVAHLGIKVTIIEPGYFRTQLLKPGNTQASNSIEDYAASVGPVRKLLEAYNGKQPGDPKKAAEIIVDIVTQSGTAKGREIPVRVALGTDAYGYIKGVLEQSSKDLEEWKDITVTTDHDDVKQAAH
jgi:NAD(P)-dependent dehydrogenase (short-subunit alcohol dehydrogenase family)